ncbi:ATP-binding cassette domain-containing protein [Candidatus Pelagibacter bacterium nBUS_30]|uniref:ATP-binding cassette domain-containing protein n=1 Tax=Candidatus Pelagibacter bacterium nBUS_30 TaxID=3374191 RepID=UPI003EBB169C
MQKEIFKVLNYLKKINKKLFYQTLIISFFSALLQSLIIYLIYPIVFYYINSNEKISDQIINLSFLQNLDGNKIKLISLFFLICLLLFVVSRLLFLISNIKLSGYGNLSLKMKYYSDFLELDYSSEIKVTKSDILTTLNVRAEKFKEFIQSILNLINNFFNCIFLSIVILIIDLKIASLLVLFGIVLSIFYIILKNFNKSFYKKEYEIYKNYNYINISYIFSKYEILMNRLEKKFSENFRFNKIKEINLEVIKSGVNHIPRLFIEFFLYFAIIVVLFLEGSEIQNNFAKIGVLALAGIRIMPVFYSIYKEYINLRILKNYFSSKGYHKKNIITKNKNIQFGDIEKLEIKSKFTYDNKKFFNFNFNIKRGDRILLYGDSGSGKSTLIKIITGIIKLQKPYKVIVDKKNINSNLVNYWKKISYLPQDGLLMIDNLKRNITLKDKLTSEEEKFYNEIFHLVQLYKIEKNINKFNNKLVDFDAKNISGGQKQRVLIARALFKKADIFLLDESFNQLDRESEIKIVQNIKKRFKNKTIIISSHRPVKNFYTKKYKL